MEGVRAALADHRQLALRYYTFGRDEWTDRVVDPYRLYSARGEWYLAAYCHEAQDERLFRLDRVERATVLDSRFRAARDAALADGLHAGSRRSPCLARAGPAGSLGAQPVPGGGCRRARRRQGPGAPGCGKPGLARAPAAGAGLERTGRRGRRPGAGGGRAHPAAIPQRAGTRIASDPSRDLAPHPPARRRAVVSRDPSLAPPRPSSPLKGALEWVAIIGGALLVALIIKATAVQAFYIPSESMVPTLKIGDRVLVNKLSYSGPLSHDINRGDIVVFERPPNESDPRVKDLIKRVIGLPGEELSGHDGQVFVNGAALDEPYLVDRHPDVDFEPIQVPTEHVWVMGDNRPNSRDSRFFGPIDDDLIVGRAFIRVWPLSSVSLL